MAKKKVQHLTSVIASVFSHAGHISKEEAREISGLDDQEFENVYAKAADISDKVMKTEGDKMETFLAHVAKEIDAYVAHYGGKLFE